MTDIGIEKSPVCCEPQTPSVSLIAVRFKAYPFVRIVVPNQAHAWFRVSIGTE